MFALLCDVLGLEFKQIVLTLIEKPAKNSVFEGMFLKKG